jgi:hypothetical protein
MIGRLALLFLIALPVAPQSLTAQYIAEAGGGVYFGRPSSLNGPLFFVRHLTRVGPAGAAGLRIEFRDDDDGGGRSQALGVALEGMMRFGPPGLTLYVPASVGLEGVFTSDYFSPEYRDIPSGVYPRLAIGLGLAMGSARGQAALEAHRTFTTYGSYTAMTLGARANRVAGQPARSQVLLYGSTLDPFGSVYLREPDFRGYTIAFQRLAPERRVQGLRLSLGIDFLDFSYSTGLIAALAGVGVDLVQTRSRAFTLRAVPQAGLVQFVEGREMGRPDVLGQLGLEASAALGGSWLVGGVAGTAGTGPDGGFTAVQYRVGVAIGL